MKNKILTMGLLAGGLIAASFNAKAEGDPKVIEITAKRFEFVPNQLTLKKGETVTLKLTTADVTHGIYQKALKIDGEVTPGKPTEITITPEKAGRFVTICDHFCGVNHGNMRMVINVVE